MNHQLPHLFGARAFIKLPEELAEKLQGAYYQNSNGRRILAITPQNELFINDNHDVAKDSYTRQLVITQQSRDLIGSVPSLNKKDSTLIDSLTKQLIKAVIEAFATKDGIYYPDVQTNSHPFGDV